MAMLEKYIVSNKEGFQINHGPNNNPLPDLIEEFLQILQKFLTLAGQIDQL